MTRDYLEKRQALVQHLKDLRAAHDKWVAEQPATVAYMLERKRTYDKIIKMDREYDKEAGE